MKTFIEQLCEHYARIESIGEHIFVLPNKRSAMHLRKALREALPENEGKRKPVVISINEFFQKTYGVETTERIPLLLQLYSCYAQLNQKAEPLDEFIHWGGVMLSDFDNVDKYLVDPQQLFLNVGDYRAMEDTFQYLTENQRKAIEQFIAHFRDDSGRLTVNMSGESGEIKAKFLRVWNLLGPLYKSFNEKLKENGMAYEGKVYRTIAEDIKAGRDIAGLITEKFNGRSQIVFAGLNALNECEKVVLRSLRDKNMAEFVWDFSSKEIRDTRNKASFFLRKNVQEFPQAFELDNQEPLQRPTVKIVSVPSATGQTKLAPQILQACSVGPAEKTAFILPDETLLMPLLSALPEQVEKVNITMGYPMTQSAIYAFMKAVEKAHLTMKVKDEKVYFHYKAVREIFSSSIFKMFANNETKKIVDAVIKDAKQWIPMNELHGSGILDTLFCPITLEMMRPGIHDLKKETLIDPGKAKDEQNKVIGAYLCDLCSLFGGLLSGAANESKEQQKDSFHDDMEYEFVARYLTAIRQLMHIELNVRPGTWLRLLDGLVRGENVPFEGDAFEGLQVMGTLESRALDFQNVIIMSANEDLFPHRTAADSFIPPELRKGFGLPTLEYQDAVWAYYFYRLIQRAENVWMLYDSRTEGLLSGEESRYIKQLEYHFGYNLERFTAVAPVEAAAESESIEKTQEDVESLRGERHLSASTLQSYLACPVKFYYQAVKGLKQDEDVAESMDAAAFGTLFHACMETLYKGKRIVSKNDIQAMLENENAIRELVNGGIRNTMKTIEVEGRNLIIAEVVTEYVKATLRHDLKLLRESGSEGFRIIGLERYLKTTIDGFNVIGFADRIDSYIPGQVRIVDYKTGHVEDEDILINDNNAQRVVEKLFGESNIGRPKIALQLYLYGVFAHEGIVRSGEQVVNSIYSTAKLLTQPLPDVPESPAFTDMVKEKLHGVLTEIADTSIPWKKACDKHVCALCDFRSICGR